MQCRATKDSSWWNVLTKCSAVEEGMENDFSIHTLRTHEQYENTKKYDIERLTPPRHPPSPAPGR